MNRGIKLKASVTEQLLQQHPELGPINDLAGYIYAFGLSGVFNLLSSSSNLHAFLFDSDLIGSIVETANAPYQDFYTTCEIHDYRYSVFYVGEFLYAYTATDKGVRLIYVDAEVDVCYGDATRIYYDPLITGESIPFAGSFLNFTMAKP